MDVEGGILKYYVKVVENVTKNRKSYMNRYEDRKYNDAIRLNYWNNNRLITWKIISV